MKMRFLLLLLLLFALFTVVFTLPRLLEKERVPVPSVQTTEPQTETLEEKSFPYETAWGETESRRPFEPDYKPGEPVKREKLPAHILFASDIHYMSRSLTDYGNAFHELIDNGDGKAVRYMPQIWDAFAGEVIAAQPDALVLSGDLTINGERVNHEELTAHLSVIEAAGVPVVVIPGNHDINNPYATAYFGDEQSFIETVTPEEFWQFYQNFGYGEAVSYAPDSMSYLYILNDTTWLLMLDTCIYTPENRVGGELRPGTMKWIEQCLQEAYAQGITVLPVGHHNLQELSRVYVEECVLQNHDEALALFERYLTPAYFSGHLHVQRIMKHKTEPGVPDEVYGIWEIVSNSLIIPPCRYGSLTLHVDGSMSYHTKSVDVSGFAAANGETNPDLLDFSAFSDRYIHSVIRRQIYDSLEDLPDYIKESLADFYAELYRDYNAGRQINYSERKKEPGYAWWDRFMNPSIQFRQVEGMMRDGMSVNHNAEIPSPY